MISNLNNESILLANPIGPFMEATRQYFHILEAKDGMHPGIHNASIQLRPVLAWTGLGVAWFCVFIVCYFRYILYHYLFQQYKLKELKPIDSLTFLVAFIDHFSTTMMIVYGTILVLTGKHLHDLIGGRVVCIAIMYLTSFGKGYSFIGGLMISVYRIILITDSARWIKNRLGLKNIFRIILFVGILIATSTVILESYNDYEKLRRDTCQLVYRNAIMLVLDEYEQSRGNPSIYSHWITTLLTVSYSRICMVLLEVIIYAIFFFHMYKHDNNELLRRLLDPNVTRTRNRNNAITFFGQFCSFSIELMWIILYIITLPQDKDNESNPWIKIRFVVRMISFTCMPVIEVLTSKTLRARIHRFSLYDFIFGLK